MGAGGRRVLFIAPPHYKFFGSSNRRVQLSLLGLAQKYQEANPSDFVLYVNGDLSFPGNAYLSWNKLVRNGGRFEEAVNNETAFEYAVVIDALKLYEPDTVVVSSGDYAVPTTSLGSLRAAATVARIARKIRKDCYVIGVGPGFEPGDDFVERIDDDDRLGIGPGKCFNGIIVGEAEDVISNVLGGRKNNTVVWGLNTKITKIPILKMGGMYWPYNKKFDPNDFDYIQASRGCVKKCSFCLWAKKQGLLSVRYRRWDAGRLRTELDYRKEIGTKFLYFLDAIFSLTQKTTKCFCDVLKEYDFEWVCDTRVDCVDEERLVMMIDSGCKRLKFGVEFPENRYLKSVNKEIDTEDIKEAFRMCKIAGVDTTCNIMLGHPDMKDKDWREGLDFFRELDATSYLISFTVPYRQTELWKRVKDRLPKELEDHPQISDRWASFWGIKDKTVEEYLKLTWKREDEEIRTYD